MYRQWSVVSAQASELKGRAEELRTELLDYAEHHGEKDPKGHQHVDLPDPVEMPGGKTLNGWTREKRVSRVVNEERARELAEKKGLTTRFFEEQVITVLNLDEIYACHQEEIISDDELAALIETTTTHALKGR